MKKEPDDTSFEEQYLSLRRKEGRLYSDEEVMALPDIRATHPLKKEWTVRKRSCKRLVAYLKQKKQPLTVLEVGCGNGWLCHRLSAIPYCSVSGCDINRMELAQARRVFPHLTFFYGTPEQLEKKEAYDVVVFAASFQYFLSPEAVLASCFPLLRAGGEVHILDTPFYQEGDLAPAAARSQDYFAASGFPGMQNFYHHHSLTWLKNYRFTVLYRPKILLNRLLGKGPFPWICIRK